MPKGYPLDLPEGKFYVGLKPGKAPECSICGTKRSPHYCASRADEVINFIEDECVYVGGDLDGDYFRLAPFQKDDIIRPLYGIVRYHSGAGKYIRLFNEVLLSIPRRNGKTTLCAALSLYHLVVEDTKNPHIYIAAAIKDQAQVMFTMALEMVDRAPRLSQLGVKHKKTDRELEWGENSFCKIITSQPDTNRGGNFAVLLADEILAFKHPAEFLATFKGGKGSRAETLIFQISTASPEKDHYERILVEQYRAIKADPTTAPNKLPIIYEITPDEDPYLEANWYKVSPGLGHFIYLEEYQTLAKEAKENPGSMAEITFLREKLNLPTYGAAGICTDQQWKASKGVWSIQQLQERIKQSKKPVFCGIDTSMVHDFSVITFITQDNSLGKMLSVGYVWCPQKSLDIFQKRMPERLAQWHKQGNFFTFGTMEANYEAMCEQMCGLIKDYKPALVGYDNHRAFFLDEYMKSNGIKKLKVGRNSRQLLSPDLDALEYHLRSMKIVTACDKLFKHNIDATQLKETPDGQYKYILRPTRDGVQRVDYMSAMLAAFNTKRNYEKVAKRKFSVAAL